MSSTHHNNSADSVRRTALAELKNQFFDDLGHLNALSVIFERFEHHTTALADDDSETLSQRELAGLVTAGKCVISAMFSVTERQQERLNVIETTVDDATYAALKLIADRNGIDPDTMASLLVQQQIQQMLNLSSDSSH